MINSQDILNNMEFKKYEEECFFDNRDKLIQEYDSAQEIIENSQYSPEELLEQFGPQTLNYYNVIDRVSVIQENLINLVNEHPSVILDEQAFRLASLASGFLENLHIYLTNKVMK